ncbi:MarR family winged helix-turn-helix transcriptional regulator [Azorhizobium doebereinerae]|uniref:MarR family winged helix-turn-helix transcriptional regulator n=1 Tax=Azorhizobium doebereinerae TaxID=281091 RepID=UPI000424741D|nr:MarR family winged helix-turn-helix transcriptional regulator [Azorhizobium doebereinerae]
MMRAPELQPNREGDADLPEGLDPLIAIKLWHNPCWFSFRINYLAMHFNVPVYDWIEKTYDVVRPEFVVLYALGLRGGIAAKDICVSSGFPKPTISRAIQRLLKRRLIRRDGDPNDHRSYVLHITPTGQEIFDAAMPVMLEREQVMLSRLTPGERGMLSEILAKIVVDSPYWPHSIATEETGS